MEDWISKEHWPENRFLSGVLVPIIWCLYTVEEVNRFLYTVHSVQYSRAAVMWIQVRTLLHYERLPMKDADPDPEGKEHLRFITVHQEEKLLNKRSQEENFLL